MRVWQGLGRFVENLFAITICRKEVRLYYFCCNIRYLKNQRYSILPVFLMWYSINLVFLLRYSIFEKPPILDIAWFLQDLKDAWLYKKFKTLGLQKPQVKQLSHNTVNTEHMVNCSLGIPQTLEWQSRWC